MSVHEVKPQTPPAVTEALEVLLEQARANMLRGLLVVAGHVDGSYTTAWSGDGTLVEKLGLLEALKYDLLAASVRE